MTVIPPEDLKPRKWSLVHYTMDVQRDDWGVLLAPFTPPLPREGAVVLVSFFGDVFVEAADGAIWWVNGTEARVDRIAASKDEFEARLAEEYVVMLKTPLVDMMEAFGRLPGPGRMYGLKTPRHEGGKYESDNIGTASVADSFAYMGGVFAAKQAAEAEGAETGAAAPAEQPPAGSPQDDKDKPKKKGWFS
jgi:hypothetical protein